MNCFICHSSTWMQKKVLGFLRNMLERHKGNIDDSEVFLPLESTGEDEHLSSQIREYIRRKAVARMSKSRRKEIPIDFDEFPIHELLLALWNVEETHCKAKEILPSLFEKAMTFPWGEGSENDLFHDRMMELQQTLKLTDEETDILLLLISFGEGLLCEPTCRRHCSSVNLPTLSKYLKLDESIIMDALASQKPLRRYQCINDDLEVNERLFRFICGLSKGPLSNSFFTKDSMETLPWNDFGDMAKTHGRMLKRMLTSTGKPVNILFYGAPGTGKTSFARALAKEIGRISYSIAQSTMDKNGRTCSEPTFRFAALQLCNSLVFPEESLVIVDEADDMLRSLGDFGGLSMLFGGSAESHTGDKGLLNTVLDSMKTSTIWIANTPASTLDESSRRRFDYSICFKPLDCEQRKHIWKNNIQRLNMTHLISSRQMEEFSALYPVSAGGISLTLENLERMHPRKSEVPRLVEQLMRPHCELLGIKLADDKLLPSKDYSLEGLNIRGGVKLERIVEAIHTFQHQKGETAPDRPRMNLLLSGAPGTGKTEFVKYLGKVLNTKVNVKMGSDLLSMWLGGTEQNIANAFREAESEHAILFLDEIDGMVQSRTNAQRTWEVTQVNEFLHQMENFNGVMIGATNYVQDLDQAIMRRFTFKLQFDFLDDEGKRIFFERMFRSPLTDIEWLRLKSIPSLTPGDFCTVRQSLFYYGGDITNVMRLEGLEREAEAKACGSFGSRERIGFTCRDDRLSAKQP